MEEKRFLRAKDKDIGEQILKELFILTTLSIFRLPQGLATSCPRALQPGTKRIFQCEEKMPFG